MSPVSTAEVEEWANNIDDVSSQIKGIIDGTITDFDEFDRKLELKARVERIRKEELEAKKQRFFLNGQEGKGEGERYKWWCKRCFVEYLVDLPDNCCTRCKQGDMMMTQAQRREELMGKLGVFKEDRARHQFRKDKWLRWKKSQAMLKRSKYINYKAWEYWEPDTDTEDEGDPIVPKNNPEFMAMDMDMKERKKKRVEKFKTARKLRERGNDFMRAGDFLAAIETYDEGLEYRRDDKSLWTNKALAELKLFRWHDAIASCNKVIEYAEIFEEGFTKSAGACYKAFLRRATALRALHRWDDAVDDLEDAHKLFPKERECKELLGKTKVARNEARRLRGEAVEEEEEKEEEEDAGAPKADDATLEGEAEVEEQPSVARPHAPVRVAIEESDEEEEEGAAAASPAAEFVGSGSAGSVGGLSAREFAALVNRLRCDGKERARFCLREAPSKLVPRKDGGLSGRKLDIAVEEVVGPSALDNLLRDAEKCRVMWRKIAGKTVPLRADVRRLEVPAGAEDEEREAAAFLQTAAPRVLEVLLILATNSDNHCELSAHAIRSVWPLLSCESWRLAVLELLFEWSQRTVSAKALAECAARNADPQLTILIEELNSAKGSGLDPSQLAGDLTRTIQGLAKPTASEHAVAILGNMFLVGQNLPVFKEAIQPYIPGLSDALNARLKAFDWRHCGRAAGAITNFLRLGANFTAAVHERCLSGLVEAAREELKSEGPISMLHSLMAQEGAELPIRRARGRLMSALANLVVTRPASAVDMVDQGVLELVLPLIDAAKLAAGSGGPTDDADPVELACRAALIISRLLSSMPKALDTPLEEDLLRRLRGVVAWAAGGDRTKDFRALRAAVASEGQDEAQSESIELLDLANRLLTSLVVKIPGAFSRVVAASERDASTAPWELTDMVSTLIRLARALAPPSYVGPEAEGGALTRLRGNVALALASVAEAQGQDSAPGVLKRLDLAPLVPLYVDCLRKERGSTQHNIGVCVTRLAQNQRYRSMVRDLNGLETLHQVQLPRVERQKEESMRQHRIRGIKGMD